jgi:lipoic acid synthetase
LPDSTVEALVPDLRRDDLRAVLHEAPDVLGHNVEVVEALQGEVRDARASYETSLEVLRTSKRLSPNLITKSSFMLGLGEGQEDVLSTMQDLADAGVDIVTIGQYLKPSEGKAAVKRYVPPQEFDFYGERGDTMGFAAVLSGPFVRSSYKAAEAYSHAQERTSA